jgi:hypothetical protein
MRLAPASIAEKAVFKMRELGFIGLHSSYLGRLAKRRFFRVYTTPKVGRTNFSSSHPRRKLSYGVEI